MNFYVMSGYGMMGGMNHGSSVSVPLDKCKENKQANKYPCVNANVAGCLATN